MKPDVATIGAGIRLATLAASCLALLGCSLARSISGANLPEQYVMASIPGDRRLDAPLWVHRSAAGNLQTWAGNVLFLCGNPGPSCPNAEDIHVHNPSTLSRGTATYGRGGSSPGAASNGEYYVMAFWGRRATDRPIDRIDSPTVAMFVSVSHDGVRWTLPQSFHSSTSVHSNSQGIVPEAGISVAPTGPNGPWFAAYADDAGSINVVRLPVTADGVVDTQLIGPSSTTVPGAATGHAPALSYLDGNLVLAWRVTGGGIRLLTTGDGAVWPVASTAATAMVAGAPHSAQGAAPYLHASGDALFLTTTSGSSPGASSVDLFTSTDGVTFSRVGSFPVSSAFLDPAAAGPAPTQFVVVQPAGGVDQARVFTSAEPQRILSVEHGRRITVAGGP